MASEDLDYSTQVVVSEGMETLEADSREGDCKNASEGVGSTGSETDLGSEEKTMSESPRAEIDTSAPFESVKEAATRFGGMGFWRPNSHKPSEHEFEAVDIAQVEEQAAQLEKDLMAKERETLDVMKELEVTKMIVEELKLKLQKGATEVSAAFNANSEHQNLNASSVEKEDKENDVNPNSNSAHSLLPSSAPGVILMELKQAKFNLTRTTNDLAGIRAAVESYNKKIETERLLLEKTRERLSSSSSKVSSLEEELSKTRLKLQQAQNPDIKGDYSDNAVDISRELQQLSCEAEQYKKLGEAAKKEVFRAMSEIEQTKTRIKTAEIRLVAARKMKEAARATEAVALAEIKALSNNEQKPEGVTLSYEEYTALTSKAHEAEEASRRKVIDTMLLVDEANASRMDILKTVEEAAEEVKASKKVLEEALNRVEAANSSKLAVEEALRKWRSENGQKRRSVQNSTKFKNTSSYPSHRRKDSHLTDINGLNLLNDEPMPVLRPTLSIGQILSRKLFLTEEFGNGMKPEKGGAVKRKMSLGQMLSRPKSPNGETLFTWKPERETGYKQQLPLKRKKFGFARFSVLMRKQNKQKKKRTPNFMCRSGLD